MFEANDRLSPNRELVAAQVIDGEAVLIRLSDGTYYSMNGTGALVWELIEGALPLRDIAAHITSRYDVEAGRAEHDLRALAKQLVEEKLAVLNGTASPPGEPGESGGTERLAYAAPTLRIYQDMRDLLALDPPAPGMQQVDWEDP